MNTNKTVANGTPICPTLFIVFLVLKLTDNITWSWWWVTSPIWLPLGVALAFVALVGVVLVVIEGIKALRSKSRR